MLIDKSDVLTSTVLPNKILINFCQHFHAKMFKIRAVTILYLAVAKPKLGDNRAFYNMKIDPV
jgi:hypothetical protein